MENNTKQRESLAYEMCLEGYTLEQIGSALGVCRERARQLVRAASGLSVTEITRAQNRPIGSRRNPILSNPDLLGHVLMTAHSYSAIVATCGASKDLVRKWAKCHGLQLPTKAELSERRFYDQIAMSDNPEDCWLWTGPQVGEGYGWYRNWITRKPAYAHRIMWQLVNGPIPRGKMICHHCDNPACVNPKHIYLGNAGTNARDRSSRGRNGTYLTWNEACEIRRLRTEQGWSTTAIAEAYGKSSCSIRNVIAYRSHKKAPNKR